MQPDSTPKPLKGEREQQITDETQGQQDTAAFKAMQINVHSDSALHSPLNLLPSKKISINLTDFYLFIFQILFNLFFIFKLKKRLL